MGAANFLDLLLIVAFAVAAVRGFRQGALAQIAAFGGSMGGLLVGAALAPRAAAAVIGQPGTSLALLTFALLVASFLVGQTVGVAAGIRLQAAARSAGVAGLDRTAGVAVGMLSIVLVVWLLGSVLVQGPVPMLARQVASSRIVAAIGRTLPPAPDLFSRASGYLQQQGFPQVFSGIGDRTTAPPVAPPDGAAVQAAQAAAQASTVQVAALGCGDISAGSGFVTQPGFVVTSAHVVAGGEVLSVRDGAGTMDAVPVLVDPALDLAVLAAPGLDAPPVAFVDVPAERDTAGATLGFPHGQSELVVRAGAVRARGEAVGRDIYGRGLVTREILTLSAGVEQGDSGGPFVTSDGRVGGLVFAAAASEPGIGYALTAEQIRDDVTAAVAANTQVPTGSCRF
jgi:S1-C subfamily serine protease